MSDMTKEKSIDILKSIKAGFETDEWMKEDVEALEKGIEALEKQKTLEQEPCEDAINRQSVLDEWDNTTLRGRTEFDQVIMMLPSVAPQSKTGHWITDINDNIFCFCQFCRHKFDVDRLKMVWGTYEFPPHCPNCGAKLKVEDNETDN